MKRKIKKNVEGSFTEGALRQLAREGTRYKVNILTTEETK